MSKYDVNYSTLITGLIPRSLRGSIKSLAWVLTHGLRVISQQLIGYRNGHWQMMSYSCQYPMLQKLLNDKLDATQRRLRVREASGSLSNIVVYPNQSIYVHPIVDDPSLLMVIYPWTQYQYREFEVVLPSAWQDDENKINKVNNLIKSYKISGTHYVLKYQ